MLWRLRSKEQIQGRINHPAHRGRPQGSPQSGHPPLRCRKAEGNPLLGGGGHGEQQASGPLRLPPGAFPVCLAGTHVQGPSLAATRGSLAHQTSYLCHPGKHLHLADLCSVLLLYPSIQQTPPGGLLLLGQLGRSPKTTERALALVELTSQTAVLTGFTEGRQEQTSISPADPG